MQSKLRPGISEKSIGLSHNIFIKLAGLISLMLSTGCSGPFSMLDAQGPAAREALMLWWLMFSMFTLVFIGVVILWFVAIRKKPDGIEPGKKMQRRWIINGGILLPSCAIIIILYFGIPAGHRMLPLSIGNAEVLTIEVTGHQWWWDVVYPEHHITLTNEIHIPAGRPINFHLKSEDVIHSFWIPQLGGKLDMLPGRTNVLRLQADAPGVYRGQCAEFCGLHHAFMHLTLHAHSPEDFEQWLQEARHHD